MTKKDAKLWVGVLRKCLREKWNALARGKAPKTMECAACNRCDFKHVGCSGCPLGSAGWCCGGLHDQWLNARIYRRRGIPGSAPEAVKVRNYIRKVREQLKRRAK